MIQRYINCFKLILLSGSILIIIAACSKRQLNIDSIATSEVEIRSILSKVDPNQLSDDSVMVYFYRYDSLITMQKISTPYDKIILPVGEYSVIMLNEYKYGVECFEMESYQYAKILLRQHLGDSIAAPKNVICYSVNNLPVKKNIVNQLTLEPENIAKSIDYQLVIGGAADSLAKCVVTQPGVARGIVIHNKQLIYGQDNGAKITFDATKENNFSGKINILGVNPEYNNLELNFTFKDNKTQNSSINISTLINDEINAKKVIMYIDVSIVNLEIKAILKSWVVIEDSINI
ncbi:MAG: hypothetical protein A2X19_00040 [Bacteroidetes bacterium GWE2_39_28]|nr:MAG: hypothetical protein A2X19_00040 [Bacteroidetes bacterium GWE2_39_28]OFY14383.1 MAG: hypothetical protein A2X16_05380 [Bacteroidetes bacterium GWF2_39_10]OFZ10280.1 MAG: hypothetical protein A2465_03295 [Bacteroidetes bacterium RIFOXYC2_FULL_39_11]HCT95254.1 hypothetical protein [Rikenellaceae bacterium]